MEASNERFRKGSENVSEWWADERLKREAEGSQNKRVGGLIWKREPATATSPGVEQRFRSQWERELGKVLSPHVSESEALYIVTPIEVRKSDWCYCKSWRRPLASQIQSYGSGLELISDLFTPRAAALVRDDR